MASINWGTPLEYSRGVAPCVAINDSGVVVEVHEVNGSDSLRYRVGVAAGSGNTVLWGESHHYSTGTTPRIAINNSGLVVEVHKSEGRLATGLWYRVGKVSLDSKLIAWGKSVNYDSGKSPAVSVNDCGTVIVVHKSSRPFSSDLLCRIGLITAEGNEISFRESVLYDNGTSPTVALNNAGHVIELHCTEGLKNRLRYNVGIVNGDTIKFCSSMNYDRGLNPSVALNNHGQVSVVHRCHSYKRTLWFRYGTFDGREISLGTACAYANGVRSSVAVNASSQFVEVHQSPGSTALCYHYTQRFPNSLNYKTWMKDNFETLKNKRLYQITLPGTHNTGTYSMSDMVSPGDELSPFIRWIQSKVPTAFSTGVIHEWSKTQTQSVAEQLAGGIRFFDLRIARSSDEFFIHHGVLGPRLSDIFHDLHTFMSSVDWELVIVSASHMEGMDESSHAKFMDLVIQSLSPFLYQNVSSDLCSLRSTHIDDILKMGPRIIFIYDDVYLRSHPNQNFWPSELIYDHWSDTNDISVLMSDQQDKLHHHAGSASMLFELQWILTPQTRDIVAAVRDKLNPTKAYAPTLLSMSQAPNQWLNNFIESNVGYQMNIIIVDFCDESDVVEQCIRLNTSDK